MKKRVLVFLFATFSIFISVSVHVANANASNPYAEALKAAYPAAGLTLKETPSGVYLEMNNQQMLLQPHGQCPQTSPDSSQDPPLCAVFSMPYPIGTPGRYPAAGFDPGRIRNQALFLHLYGQNEAEVAKNCVKVNFLGQKVPFNARQGAAAALGRVSDRLGIAVQANPALKEYIFPLEGTLNWRPIKGSQRLSAHSFGVAIDLNVGKGLYWLWNPRPTSDQVAHTRQDYPQVIVDAFEAEGFIWGGKWAAYDFMHFEYRPELFLFRK